jgi:hypothetical protein
MTLSIKYKAIKNPATGTDKYNHPMEMPRAGEEASETVG